MKLFLIIPLFILQYVAGGNNYTINNILLGGKIIDITLTDSLRSEDLSRVSVDGYNIENAVFVQENDPALPFQLKENVVALYLSPELKLIQVIPQKQVYIIESPSSYIWEPGTIITDTSYNGWSRKIIHAEEYKRFPGSTYWSLTTTPVSLVELIEQCDISFTSQPNLVFSMPDSSWAEPVLGMAADMYGMQKQVATTLSVSLSKVNIKIRPVINGRLRIIGGQVQSNSFQVNGPYDLFAQIRVDVPVKGTFNYKKSLPFAVSHCIPLGPGFLVTVTHSAEFTIKMDVSTDGFHTVSQLNMSNDLNASLNYKDGLWQQSQASIVDLVPPAQTFTADSMSFSGSGVAHFTVTPQVLMLWGGETGASVYVNCFNKVFQNQNYLASVNRSLHFGVEVWGQAERIPDSNVVSDVSFIMGSLKNNSFSPPVYSLMVEVQDTATDTLVLNWQHLPDVENYYIQMQIGDFFQTIDSVVMPPVTVRQLSPSTMYAFRVIPANSFGVGIPALIMCRTPEINFPPSAPTAVYPLPDSTLSNKVVGFAWSSRDPDYADTLRFTLYLDTINPPERVISRMQTDTVFATGSLVSNKSYFWKVDVTDGKHLVEGEVCSFTLLPKPIAGSLVSPEKLVFIPAGTFLRSDQVSVSISAFYLQKYEITQNEFQGIMGFNPSFKKGELLPVENVNWDRASTYCREIGGRLPTEAEWEYAARAGTHKDYYWQEEDASAYAWYYHNSNKQSHPVGKKLPNAWGLYDMSGNVFEWVADWHQPYSQSNYDDPKGPAEGIAKVTRGGSWYSERSSLKVSARFKNRPSFSSYKLGFRCAFSVK
ncbi:MAG: SUMF1/EgtB/PvdO family nonheme iron enzyme [Fibrobacteria bacterium]|nr:SUMF1/EgtB/PvdO family nonheme iron enzyme [Fibrobacteria bacterium]